MQSEAAHAVAVWRDEDGRIRRETLVRPLRGRCVVRHDTGAVRTHADVRIFYVDRGSALPRRCRPSPPRPGVLVPVAFRGCGQWGDFAFMLRTPAVDDGLFLYNDNVESHDCPTDTMAGGGNACARTARHVHALGIPTGSFRLGGGFTTLCQDLGDGRTAQTVIDEALARIDAFWAAHPHKRIVYYSARSETDDVIGTGIFEVGEDVCRYITNGLRARFAEAFDH